MTRISLWIIAFVLTIAFSGCRSLTPAVKYYTLSPLTPNHTAATSDDSHRTMMIGIHPVELPGAINRKSMVTRTGRYQLEISSFHRWADYPDRMVQRVIGEDLQLLMVNAQILNTPWPLGLKPDITISFQFMELIGTSDKVVHLSAMWTIAGQDEKITAHSHRLTLSESMAGTGYDDLAAAHSRALEALCRKVAESLHTFQE